MGKLEVPSRDTRKNMAKSVAIGDLNPGLHDHNVRFRRLNAELHKRN